MAKNMKLANSDPQGDFDSSGARRRIHPKGGGCLHGAPSMHAHSMYHQWS